MIYLYDDIDSNSQFLRRSKRELVKINVLDVYDELPEPRALIGYYKYMHKMPLLMYINFLHPLSLRRVFKRVMKMLDAADRHNFIHSSVYLRVEFGFKGGALGYSPGTFLHI